VEEKRELRTFMMCAYDDFYSGDGYVVCFPGLCLEGDAFSIFDLMCGR